MYGELASKLKAAVLDRGRAARDFIENEARASDDLQLTFWCYAALAAWNREGLDLINNIAVAGHTVKSKSAALTLLSTLAVRGKLLATDRFMIDPDLATLINGSLDEQQARIEGRQALGELVLSLPTDDLLVPVSQSFMHFAIADADVAEQLVGSLASKWIRFGPPVLDLYESMFVAHANDEPEFQKFFCDYPQLLDPMAVEVWSQPDFHGALEPDFVIRRADNTYLVVEIECPGKRLVTAGNQISGDATHAETQALEYEDFLSSRAPEAAKHFPDYRRADCLTIIGLERSLNSVQRRALDRANGRKQNSRISGFDWLLERARTVVKNVGDGRIDIILGHRMI